MWDFVWNFCYRVSAHRCGVRPRVYWRLDIVCSRATTLTAPLPHVATEIPALSIVCLGCKVCVCSGVDLLLPCVSASVLGQAVCVVGSECGW